MSKIMDGILAAKDEFLSGQRTQYEWKAMSDWLAENAPSQGENVRKTPADDGWEVVGGALRRPLP